MINVLSVDKINSITPYHVQLFEKDGSYRFVTDNDVKLAVSFMYDDMIIQEGAYQLIIANIVRNDNPNMIKLINEFSETAQLLSQKP